MHFWHLDHLKQELAFGRHDESMTMPYCFALLAFEAVATLFAPYQVASPSALFRIHVSTAAAALINLAGTYYVFLRNGGWAGRDFFTRLFPLYWVVFCRFIALVFLPVTLAVYLVGAYQRMPIDDIRSILYMAVVIAYVPMFWRVGKHTQDVARASTAGPVQ